MPDEMSGGCACGRIRYAAKVAGDDAYLCHCRMCQRASGNVSLALKNVRLAEIVWAREPDWFDSSAIAVRPFCATCGTSLGFKYKDAEEWMDLTVASFDDPSRFKPASHFGVESIHEDWLDTRDLPRKRSDEYQKLVDRWAKAASGNPG